MAAGKKRIGFIGLGIMGKPMAAHLLSRGYPLTVFNKNREEPRRELAALGATVARSAREVAERSEVIVIMVPDTPDAIEVIMGKEGVLQGAKKGDTIILTCTILPGKIPEIEKDAKSMGVKVLDAPVSGSRPRAEAGTLSFMVGGEREDFEANLDLFQAMGQNVIHAGPLGAGTILKLVNNLILFVTLEGMSEGLLLGAKAGLDPKIMVEALKKGTAHCQALEYLAPKILARDFSPSAPIRLSLKTAGLIVSTGKELGVPLPFASLVPQRMNALKVEKGGDIDTSALILLLEEEAGMEVRG